MPEKVVEGNRKSRRPRRDSRPRLSDRSQLDIRNRYLSQKISANFDARLRMFIYRNFIRKGWAPSITEMVKGTGSSRKELHASLDRLCSTHAFVLQENGELWRAAPFSAVPTAFPVKVGKHSYYANCIWDALGIPAMLHKDAQIDASCGCCNLEMLLKVENGRLLGSKGLIHIAVPARDWYKDIVFT
jgi:Alkylmercury lyase